MTHRLVANESVMGTVMSLHIIGPEVETPIIAAAIAAVQQRLHDDETLFSPFRSDSQISLLRVGKLLLPDADPRVQLVASECEAWRERTQGRFDPWWEGWLNPTGLVKGWSVENAFSAHLVQLLNEPEVVAVGLNLGGDLRVATKPGESWTWTVGIADPANPVGVVERLELQNGAVASSGTAMRGEHIIDPATSLPAALTGAHDDVASATVVAQTLDVADVWATTAVVAGFDDLTWADEADVELVYLIAGDGRVRSWPEGSVLPR